jgi:hypothetical protein
MSLRPGRAAGLPAGLTLAAALAALAILFGPASGAEHPDGTDAGLVTTPATLDLLEEAPRG